LGGFHPPWKIYFWGSFSSFPRARTIFQFLVVQPGITGNDRNAAPVLLMEEDAFRHSNCPCGITSWKDKFQKLYLTKMFAVHFIYMLSIEEGKKMLMTII